MKILLSIVVALAVLTMDELDIDHHHHDRVSHRIQSLLDDIKQINIG